MEPISTTAAVIYFFGRLGVWLNKKDKKDKHEAARTERHQVADRYGASSQVMMRQLEILSNQRFGYTRELLTRIARTARKVQPSGQPFDPENGWFAGKSFDEVLDLVDRVDTAFGRTVNAIDEKVSLAMLSVVALQGIEYLDSHHIFEVPLLDDSLQQIFSLPDLDPGGVGDIVNGILDAPLADVLAGPLFVFGLWRIADNLSKAEDYQQETESMRSEIRAVESSLNAIDNVNARARAIASELDEASYQAFKSAWMTDILSRRTGNRLDPRYGALLRSFENAARRFYALLNERLDVSGVTINFKPT